MARGTRIAVVVGVLVAVSVVGVSNAFAAKVSVVGPALVYTTGAKETNRVTIAVSGENLVVTDTSARIVARAGCERVDAHQAVCPAAGVSEIQADLGARDDSLTANVPLQVFAQGGSGADTLVGGSANDGLGGGGGSDTIAGDAGFDVIAGEAAADELSGGPDGDQLSPGLGADVIAGGDGFDIVDYSERTASVRVVLDGLANDGEAGENDAVGADVEDAFGGSGDDVLIGNDDRNALSGGDGDDYLDGGFGGDPLSGGPGLDTVDYSSRTNSVLVGITDAFCDAGEANELDCVGTDIEHVIGGHGNDSLFGSASAAVVLEGREGDDVLGAGSPFQDVLQGGDGNDSLSSRDGNADEDSCGDGTDSVTADGADVVAADCETIDRAEPI